MKQNMMLKLNSVLYILFYWMQDGLICHFFKELTLF